MDTLFLAVNTTLMVVNGLLLVASLNKYAAAVRLLDDAKKIAMRAVLLRGGRK